MTAYNTNITAGTGLRQNSLASKIFAIAKNRPVLGVTSDEVFSRLGGVGSNVNFQTLTGRISELKSKGLLVDTGTTRELATGKQGQVLRISSRYVKA